MKRLVIILFLVSICYGTPFILVGVRGDTFTNHLRPITDSTLDVGTATLYWRYIYGDAFTDGTASWDTNSLLGFISISGITLTDTILSINSGSITSAVDGTFSGTLTGSILTDGIFIATGGIVTAGTWQGTTIDISDYTNLVAGTNITLAGDTLNVDDAFLVNDASDTTTGIITSAGFTTTGAVTAGASTFGDGGTTDYTGFSNVGKMNMYGDARVGRHLVIGGASWRVGATAPTVTYENIFPTISFNANQNDQAHYTTIVPYRWDDSTDMVVEVHWQTPNSADTGKVLWKLKYIAVKLGEDPAGAGTEISQLSTGNHPQDELIETYFDTNILAANLEREDSLGLLLWRNGSDGSDDLGEDAELIAVHIHYVMNELGQQMDVYFLLLETGDFILLETGDKIILEGI